MSMVLMGRTVNSGLLAIEKSMGRVVFHSDVMNKLTKYAETDEGWPAQSRDERT